MQRVMILGVFLAALALSLTVGGCARASRVTAVPISGIPQLSEYPTLLEIENFQGSVRVVVDNTREPGVWTRVRRAGSEAPRRRHELQELVEVEATSETRDGARILRVVTNLAPEASDVTADLTVRIGRSAGVAVRNSGGYVELVGVSGPVHVENGIGGQPGGDIQVRTGQSMTAPAYLSTSSGSVIYQVGPGSTGKFDLRSQEGRAEFSSRLGRVDNVTSGQKWWHGTLSGGQNEVVLRGDGDVRVMVMQNADTYRPSIWPGSRAERFMNRISGE